MRTKLLLLPTIAISGCAGGAMTVEKPESLGGEIVAAIAKVVGEPPPSSYPMFRAYQPGPLNLAETVIDADWDHIPDPYLAAAVAKYAEEEFPGILVECPEYNCGPLSPPGTPAGCPESGCGPVDRPWKPLELPPGGLLSFWHIPTEPLNTVGASHLVFVPLAEVIRSLRAKGREDLIGDYRESNSNGWVLMETVYSVEVERLETGGWRVGKAEYKCCA